MKPPALFATLEFPLLYRELDRQAGNRYVFVLRLVPVGLLFLGIAGASLLWHDAGELLNAASTVIQSVSVFFQVCVVCLWIPLTTASLVTREKQEGTLELLLLADFRGSDVYWAKFAGAYIQAATLIVVTVPPLAIMAFMGGVAMPVVVLRTGLFLLSAWLMCAVGMLCSTVSLRPSAALSLTFGFEVLCFAVSWASNFTGHPIDNPLTIAREIDASTLGVGHWGHAAAVGGVLSLLAIALAQWLLPRQIRKPAEGKILGRHGKRRRRFFTPADPAARLIASAFHETGGSRRQYLLQGLVALAVVLLVLLPVPRYLAGMIYSQMSWFPWLFQLDGALAIRSIRRHPVIEELLLTGLNRRQYVSALYRASANRSLWLYPVYLSMVLGFYHSVLLPFMVAPPDWTDPWVWAVLAQMLLITAVAAWTLQRLFSSGGVFLHGIHKLRFLRSSLADWKMYHFGISLQPIVMPSISVGLCWFFDPASVRHGAIWLTFSLALLFVLQILTLIPLYRKFISMSWVDPEFSAVPLSLE